MDFEFESAISREEHELLEKLERLAYFFGVFLGDGCVYDYRPLRNQSGVAIDCMDREIIERCFIDISLNFPEFRQARLYARETKHGTKMYGVRWNGIFSRFVRMMTNDKEKLPDYIWHASKKAKLEMLAGLMDTDGTISATSRGPKREGAILYRLIFSGKKGFVRQFPDLCRVLGINTSVQQSSRDFTYDFRLSLPDAIHNGFYFNCIRKQEKLQAYYDTSYRVKGGRPLGS